MPTSARKRRFRETCSTCDATYLTERGANYESHCSACLKERNRMWEELLAKVPDAASSDAGLFSAIAIDLALMMKNNKTVPE